MDDKTMYALIRYAILCIVFSIQVWEMSKEYFYISRNYKAQASAAGKAKIDCEKAMEEAGFRNLGLPQGTTPGSILGFFITLFSTIIGLFRLPRKSVICVQYPTKKYYELIVGVARLKKCRVITVIHDLRAHRKQKMDIDREIQILNRNDVIISHNQSMSQWLRERNLTIEVVNLNIFDYYSDLNRDNQSDVPNQNNYSLIFAGVLEKRKNGFIYAMDQMPDAGFTFNLYGVGFDENDVSKDSIIDYRGVFPASEIASRIKGDFGLVWDGVATNECAGSFGEYLKINNPHKTSMYLRAGVPIVIWDQAAMAKFVLDNNVGIAVSSLAHVREALTTLSREQYDEMKANAEAISEKLGSGFYFKQALDKATRGY